MLSLMLPALALAEQDALLDQADGLLKQKQAEAAYTLLQAQESERAGQPDYDYLLGLAALESGNAADAVFAFDRCLAVDPRNGPCRVQMARAQLALGERDHAREELSTVAQSAPPAAIAQMIHAYLGDIDATGQMQRRGLSGYLDLGAGYDTNANLATNQQAVNIPLFYDMQLPLSFSGFQRPSGFAQSLAGLQGFYRFGAAWSAFAGLDVADRDYFHHGLFNYRYDSPYAGGEYHYGADLYRLSVHQQNYELDGSAFRKLWGGTAEYQHAYSEATRLTVNVEDDRLSYPQDQPFNIDRRTLGAGWSHSFPVRGQPSLALGIDGGQEAPRTPAAYNGDNVVGGRLGASLELCERLALGLNLAAEQRHYDAVNPVFFVVRKDEQVDASLSLIWNLGYGFSLRPSYAYTHNRSDIILNGFARTVSSLDLRLDM